MKHTECKDCEFSNGDCGYHFKMDGKTNFDIASLSACDKYGNCEFFKAKTKPQGDLISREALKKALKNRNECENCTDIDCINCFYDLIDNAPAETPQNEWVPVSERMPEGRIDPVTNDFEYVLCSTTWNDVRSYKFGKRIGEDKAHFWYGGVIMDEYITAWQPLPKPYQKGDAV